nr:MAG TPA: hypothetical protein [Caudoviricetes sp.]
MGCAIRNADDAHDGRGGSERRAISCRGARNSGRNASSTPATCPNKQ